VGTLNELRNSLGRDSESQSSLQGSRGGEVVVETKEDFRETDRVVCGGGCSSTAGAESSSPTRRRLRPFIGGDASETVVGDAVVVMTTFPDRNAMSKATASETLVEGGDIEA
jgi:hypothetical protein